MRKHLLAGMIISWAVTGFQIAQAADGKLIGTAGLVQLEGSGGGGIVPWATLAGYDSRDQVAVSAVVTQVDVEDYRLGVTGVAVSLYDRVELSLAHQRFDLKTLGTDITQTIYGAKYRLYGDAVYSTWPQLSLGVQYKKLKDPEIALLLGADDDSGTDLYLAATKVHLGAVAGYNAVWNLAARATKANQMGLLGFGAVDDDSYEIVLEASAGVFFNRHFALGAEYRQKPDNLGPEEQDWWDVFVTYIPSKDFNVTLAWSDLGTIAGAPDQEGFYLAVNGQLW